MNKKTKYIIGILAGLIVMLYFYTLLHEGGHALVAIVCGGKLEKLVLGINAHVQTSGANFTTFSEALFNSAGMLLPVIFLTITLITYNVKIKNEFYHIFYGLLSLTITSSLLAWVIVPGIALFSLPPPGDDTTKFLNITGLHPLAVVLTAILIIAALIFLIYRKGLFRKLKEIFSMLFKVNSEMVSKVIWVRLLIGIVLAAIIAVAGYSILIPKPVFKKSLSLEAGSAPESLKLPFKVEKSKLYSMDLKLTAKGILTDIQIYTENGTLVYQNICEWFTLGTSINLEKGNYVFVLTFLKDQIAMQEHFDSMGYKFEADVLEQLKGLYSKKNLSENNAITFSGTIK